MPPDLLTPRADRTLRRTEIAEFLEHEFDPRIEHLLVFEDDAVEGFVHIVCEDKAELGAAAHINLLYVSPSRFGRGIGRQLMRAAAEWLEAQSTGAIVLSAYALNPYRHFYARLGGVAVKTAEVAFGEHRLDVVYYRWPDARSLREGTSG